MSTHTHEPEVIDSTGMEIVPHEQESVTLFRTDDPVEVITRATMAANALKDVIQQRRLYKNIQGKDHVLVEGWQLLGSMLGVTAVCVGTEEVDGGWKATVEARTLDGRTIGRADALCTKHEKRGPWKSADDYARLSMAQTRATSKALKGPLGFVVSLAGYATTPAEEMTFAEPEAQRPAEAQVVTADPPKPTVKTATAAQRRKINAQAAERGLTALQVLNAIRIGIGLNSVEVPEEEAGAKAARILDRLPAEHVDGILEAIQESPR